VQRKPSVGVSAEQPMITNDFAVTMGANNDGLMKSLDICLPVCVYSYERDKHLVTVVPLVKQAYFQGSWKSVVRAPFTVTMRSIQCGGFAMEFPVYVGDTGWVFSSDRDTSFLKEEDSPASLVLGADRELAVVEDVLPQPAKQPRIHALADGFFIPDNWGRWDYQRFKDSDDISLKDALYIGTSFYDEDEAKAPDGSGSGGSSNNKEDDKDKDEDSDDGTYEGNPSVSIAMTRDGSLNLMASSKESEKKKAHLRMRKDKIGLKVVNSGDDVKLWEKIESSISLDDGIALDCTGEKHGYSFTVDTNGLEMKYRGGQTDENKVAVITISPDLDVNISTEGSVTLSSGDVTAQCKNINLIGEDAVVNVGNVTGTVGKLTINSSAEVDIRATNRVSVASESDVSIGAAGTINVGGVGQSGSVNITSYGGSVHVSATGSDDGGLTLESPNGSIRMGGDGVAIKGEKVSISGELVFDTQTGQLNGKQFINGGQLIIA
jgi:hypothetical protein